MQIKLVTKTLFVVLGLFSPIIFAANSVFHYAPKIVALTGVIKIKTFPGAPNYESVAAGDDLEPCPYLLLSRSIDVVTSSGDEDHDAETERNLKIIQIAAGEDYDNWNDKYIGKRVRVIGTLYHRLTGHHHTRVLIDAQHFEIAQ